MRWRACFRRSGATFVPSCPLWSNSGEVVSEGRVRDSTPRRRNHPSHRFLRQARLALIPPHVSENTSPPRRWPRRSAGPCLRPKPSRNSRGSQFSQPRPVDVGRVGGQRRDARVEGVGGVDAVLGPRGSRTPTPARTPPHGSRPSASCSGKTHRLPASRDGVEHGPADRDVVGLVEVAAAEGVAEVAGDHDLRPVPADDLGQRSRAQRHAVLDDAVGQPEELDDVDADDARRLDLLGLADACGTRRGACRRCRPRRW